MTIYVENETDFTFPFDTKELCSRVAEAVLDAEGCPYETEINVLITDNEGIRLYNKEYRNIDRETDVLSFPNIPFETEADFSIVEENCSDYFQPDSGELILGDIILSVDRICSQAESYGHSRKREFAFLVAHSMLHLCGYDHETPEEAAVMAARRKHKKIDRTGVLPRQLTGVVKFLAFLLCLFAPIRLVNALGDEGCADFFGALEGCFVLFSLFGIGMNRAVSNLIRTRIERYGITGAKKIAGQALLTAFFVSVVLALLGAALKDVLFGSFYALPFAKMAFLALLCALVILTLFWMLLGILDAFGRRETAGRWILAFGVLLFFAAPLIAAPLDAYGQKVGALLQNTSYQAAYGAFGAAFSVLCVSLLCTAGCGISWIKASHELHQAEYGSSTNPAADRSITFALLRNGLVICVPAVLAGIGRIGQSGIYLKNGSVSTWGAYLGKYRLLMTLALLGAFALAVSMLPQFQLVLKRRSLRKSREKCMVAFRCTALYTIPCAVLFLTTAQPMLHMLFSKGELNGLDSILKVLAITVIFYGLAFMLGSVLFAAELYYSIWIAVLVSVVVRLVSFSVMSSALKLDLYAGAYSDALSAFVLCLILLGMVRQQLKIAVSWLRVFLAPLLAGILMALVCLLCSQVILKNAASPVRMLVSAVVGLLVYFVSTVVLKGATRRELRCFAVGDVLIELASTMRLL